MKASSGDGESKSQESRRTHSKRLSSTPPEPVAEQASPEPNGSIALLNESEFPVEQLQQQLVQELNDLVTRLKELSPAFMPTQIPGAQSVLDAVQDVVGKSNFEKMRSVAGDLLDPDTWKGAWYILNQTVQFQTETVTAPLARRI